MANWFFMDCHEVKFLIKINFANQNVDLFKENIK